MILKLKLTFIFCDQQLQADKTLRAPCYLIVGTPACVLVSVWGDDKSLLKWITQASGVHELIIPRDAIQASELRRHEGTLYMNISLSGFLHLNVKETGFCLSDSSGGK